MKSPTPFYLPALGEPDSAPGKLPVADWRQGMIVRSTNWLGDAVMTLPAVWKMRQLMPPGKRLAVVCPGKLKGLWQAIPWVDEVISFSGRRIDKDVSARIRAFDAGVAVVLPNSFGSALDLAFKGIPLRIGRGGRFRSLLLSHRLPAWKRVPGQDRFHQLREYLQIARFCGSAEWDDTMPPAKPQVDFAKLAGLGCDLSQGSWLAVAPGAAFGPAKQWPLDLSGEVCRRWMATGRKVVIVGAPGEEAAGAKLAEAAPGAINLVGRTSVGELMAILGGAFACLVNDSGAMHLAAAVGGRGVAVFGSTDPTATGPLGGRFVVLWHRPECSPCLQRDCPLTEDRFKCLRGTTPDQVWAALPQ